MGYLVADEHHLAILLSGVEPWNRWRSEHSEVSPDLSEAILDGMDLREADLRGADLQCAHLADSYLNDAELYEANLSKADLREAHLSGANLRWAKLSGANLSEASLWSADLSWANLSNAYLWGVDLSMANLRGADLQEANLTLADLSEANLSEANLRGANLIRANLIETCLNAANLNSCIVYGVSVWKTQLTGAVQTNLRITLFSEPEVTVDNLEMAQFLYLMLYNEKVKGIIDTLTSKIVLILGRFTEPRKAVLEALRQELRLRGYIPVLFDFDGPSSRDTTETITFLARMARFVVADLTDPRSIPHELQAIVPTLAVPVQPILVAGASTYAMFRDNWKYHWVLPVYQYSLGQELLRALPEKVIAPAEAKALELQKQRLASWGS